MTTGHPSDIARALHEEELEPEASGVVLEVESADETGDGPTWAHIPPPDRKLVTQPYDLAVDDLVSQIENGDLKLAPVYQRQYVWDNKKASKLVESLLINVPIPVCYLAEEEDGSRSTIDGQQRLRSLARFLDNQFPLQGLEVLSELNGKRFHELSQREQRLVRKRTIRCIVIGEDSHPDIRFDVFERLNTGSVALTPQEIRNSAYRGSLNDLLHELAAAEIFRRCLDYRANTRMTSEELVLRFLALDDELQEYRPSLKLFLSDYMRNNRRASKTWIEEKRARFLATTEMVFLVFWGNSFRRARREDGKIKWIPQINSALFDVIMLNFARLSGSEDHLKRERKKIRVQTARLIMDDEDFADAISRATGDRARLHLRVGMYSRLLSTLGFESGLADVVDAPAA
jgi:Protein of unknown function DUF262